MASKRRVRKKQCGSKIKYKSEKLALSALILLKKDKDLLDYFTVYRCKFCKSFHFGHSGKRLKAIIEIKREFKAIGE